MTKHKQRVLLTALCRQCVMEQPASHLVQPIPSIRRTEGPGRPLRIEKNVHHATKPRTYGHATIIRATTVAVRPMISCVADALTVCTQHPTHTVKINRHLQMQVGTEAATPHPTSLIARQVTAAVQHSWWLLVQQQPQVSQLAGPRLEFDQMAQA